MTLYHACRSDLRPGSVIKPGLERSKSEDRRRIIDEYLDSHRPEERRGRLSSVFACEKPEDAAKFLQAELDRNPGFDQMLHVFEVECDESECSRHPMALAGYLGRIGVTSGFAPAIAEEYWKPQSAWCFWETLCPELSVVARVDTPNRIEFHRASHRHQSDWQECKESWPVELSALSSARRDEVPSS
jgi:hypothetical protein